eukprot:TRINITY_DN7646_c0_g1_i2.p1 TRINITY_DN7646_c0_g1~~TRINITY_DN7646_c0_g1_i2.p1  ORF type:complete len:615 (-),score=102.04 TRINITY_DN7646_c0_g1_i2:87-1931(-)
MDDLLKPPPRCRGNSPSALLGELLAEERDAFAKFMYESHVAITQRFECRLSEMLKVGPLEMSPSSNGPTLDVSGQTREDTFATLTCHRLLEPLQEAEAAIPFSPEILVSLDQFEAVSKHWTSSDDEGWNRPGTDRSATPDLDLDDSVASERKPRCRVSIETNMSTVSSKSPNSECSASMNLPYDICCAATSTTTNKIRVDRQPNQISVAKRMINNPIFESVFAALIFFNALCMGFEQQYIGFNTGYDLEVAGQTKTSEETWPHAEAVFFVAENFFGIVFTGEVVLKLAVFRVEFFRSLWNIYDSLIIVCWLIQNLSLLKVAIPPLLLRLTRMGRLLRLLRFAKSFQVFDVLHLLVRSLAACMNALMWSFLFIFIVMLGTSLMLMYLLEPAFKDEAIPYEERVLIYTYFGTFTNSMFAMYELTMGNWVPISRTIVQNISEWYIILFVIYRTFVGFAVLKVVTAIFNAETFRVTQNDDGIMLMHKERQIAMHTRRMKQLLLEGDDSQDGNLSMREFKDLLSDKQVQKWLLAQEIELKDVELAFSLIDSSGDGSVDAEELVRGLARLKGAARSSDMMGLLHKLDLILRSVDADQVARNTGTSILHRLPTPLGYAGDN